MVYTENSYHIFETPFRGERPINTAGFVVAGEYGKKYRLSSTAIRYACARKQTVVDWRAHVCVRTPMTADGIREHRAQTPNTSHELTTVDRGLVLC